MTARTGGASSPTLTHPLLETAGIWHAFGQRGASTPDGLVRPRQVHGATVAELGSHGLSEEEADAVVSARPGEPIAIVTADCVPILAATESGVGVAAIHAGWRGLAAGVIRAGIEALRRSAGDPGVAVIGPHIGPCCYEVDRPVLAALEPRFGGELDTALRPSRSGHWRLDLGRLAEFELRSLGLSSDVVGRVAPGCTFCDVGRFHSFRRDGARSGRLVHFIAASRVGIEK